MDLKKIISLTFFILFCFCAYLQLNDPDPQVWIPIYLLAAFACLSVFVNKTPHQYVFWAMSIGYLVAAYLQWPPQFEGFMFDTMKMHSLNIELARESGGLSICACVMALMGWFLRK